VKLSTAYSDVNFQLIFDHCIMFLSQCSILTAHISVFTEEHLDYVRYS